MPKPMNPTINFTTTLYHDTYPFVAPAGCNLKGRRVLVSGSSKGIGKAMAISFARAGCSHIALLARSSLSSISSELRDAAESAGHQPPELLELTADLTSASSIDAAAKKLLSSFGGLDLLVNNAGYLETWKKIDESDPEDWWRTWEVNVKGTYLMIRAFLPVLLKGGEKTIVTVSSGGAWASTPSGSAYQGSKTAQVRLNNHLMAEYGEQGILAYSIHPGGVKTELAAGMPEFMHAILIDEPALAADTVVWLTKERREWLADRYLSCCWDMEEILSKKDEIVSRDLLKLSIRM